MLPANYEFSLPEKTKNFLDNFPNTIFTYIPDDKTSPRPVIHSQLLDLKRQKEGYGIYFSVNGFISDHRKADEIKNLNAFFCDIDYPDKVNRTENNVRIYKNELIQELAESDFMPTAIVETKNGLHLYWVLESPVILTNYDKDEANRIIIEYLAIIENILDRYDGDKGAKDVTRVLRVPHTYHQKDPNDVFMCELIHYNKEQIYSWNEVKAHFPAYHPVDRWAEVNGENALTPDIKTKLQKLYPKLLRPSYQVLMDKVNGPQEGNRNKALLIVASAWKQSGKTIEEAFEYFDQYNGLGLREIRTAIRSAYANSYDFGYNNEVMQPIVQPQERQKLSELTSQVMSKEAKTKVNTDKEYQKEMYAVYESEIARRYPNLIYMEMGDFYEYSEGYYQKRSIEHIKNLMFREMLEDGLTNYRKVSAINDKIAAFKSLPGKTFGPNEADSNKNIINLKNGLLDVSTYELKPHTPGYLSTNQIPIHYNGEAQAPRWEQFIAEITDGDETQIRLLQQLTGYCLTTDVHFAKAFVLFGRGANGKSLFTRLLEKLIGPQNVSSLTLTDIARQFGLVGMVGKKINLIDEISGHYFESNIIKSIVSGEKQLIDVKFRPEPLEFVPTAKIIFSVNELPKINDTTPGLYRRFCIIPFNRSFIDNPDLFLEQKLASELTGILNWAITGLKDLREMGRFSETAKNLEALQGFKSDNSPVLEFLNESCEPDVSNDSRYEVTINALYEKYKNYCRDNGYSPKSISRFTRELFESDYYGWTHLRKKREGKFTTVSGLRINSQPFSPSKGLADGY